MIESIRQMISLYALLLVMYLVGILVGWYITRRHYLKVLKTFGIERTSFKKYVKAVWKEK